jgi:hypothetical protein
MTIGEYAGHRGVTAPSVSRAIKLGHCPVMLSPDGRKMIDSDIADAQWPLRNPKNKTEEIDKKIESTEKSNNSDSPNLPPIIQSRAIREAYQSRMAKLDYEERVGKTIDADKVKEDTFKVARIVRDNLLNIPDRLAAELAGEQNQYVIHKKLSDEIKRAILDVVNIIQNQENYE